MRQAKHFFKGKSLYKYCKENNLNYCYILSKVSSGIPIEEAVKSRSNKNVNDYKYIYNGQKLQDYCKDNKINYGTIVSRVLKGQTLDEAINSPQNNKVKYKYKGLSLRKYCLKNNLNYDAICMRINRGYSVEEAIKQSVKFKSNDQQKLIKDIENGKILIDLDILPLVKSINRVPGILTVKSFSNPCKIYFKIKSVHALNNFYNTYLKDLNNIWSLLYEPSCDNQLIFCLKNNSLDRKVEKDNIKVLTKMIEKSLKEVEDEK